MGETANTSAPDPAVETAPAARKAPVVITLDHTKDFSTVHGERGPSDPHYNVCFMQNGLPFDAEEKLIVNHPMVKENKKAKEIMEKMIARAEKLAAKRAAIEDDDDPETDETDNEDDGDEAIDLKSWAMGLKQYRWQLVSDAIVLKFQRRVTNKRDALESLIAEGVVQMGQLSREHRNSLSRL